LWGGRSRTARAAHGIITRFLLSTDGVHNFNHVWFELISDLSFGISFQHSLTNSGFCASAALLSLLLRNIGDVARRLLALQFTFWTRAGSGFSATPIACGFFAQWRAFGFWGNASGVAFRRSTHGLTFGAIIFFAHILRASNRAFGLGTMNSAFCALTFFTLHLALRACTDGVANSRAGWVIALPATSWVALGLKQVSFDC